MPVDTRWIGAAGAVAEVNTITIGGTWVQGDQVTITINAKTLIITVGTLVTTDEVAQTVMEGFNGDAFTDAALVHPVRLMPSSSIHSSRQQSPVAW